LNFDTEHTGMRRLATYLSIMVPLLGSADLGRGDEAAEQLVLATYKLANDASTATGVVIRCETSGDQNRRFLATGHHVFEQMSGDACVLVSRKARDDGAFQRQEIRIAVRKDGQPLWIKHPVHDLAILPLPDQVQVNSLPLDCLATEDQISNAHVGDAVRLAVFPERSEANGAGFPVLRGGSIAGYPLVPVASHPAFLVDTTSWKGDSGGPVMHATARAPGGGPLVLGIVHGMRQITDTVQESRFVQRTTHYPLGISEVLHAGFLRALIASHLADQPPASD
jgi:hypothetical protein